jgi:DNA-binding transcriptional regulator YhcF (GntR family)
MNQTIKYRNREQTQSLLENFLDEFGIMPKKAEDPSRPALTPDDVKEGKPQTDEVDKGDGGAQEQGELGKEMANEVKQVAGEGGSVENAPENSGDSTAVGIKDPAPYTESPSPDEDINKMDNVAPEVKEANLWNASFIRLSNAVVDQIDQIFEENAAKNASEDATDKAALIKRAQEMKALHVDFLMKNYGISAKQASDILNDVADNNPAAILPPEAIAPEEADAIIADAAAADAGAAPAPEEGAATAEEPAPAGGEEDIDAQIDAFIQEAQAQGLSDDEIADALEQAVQEVSADDGGAEAPAADAGAAPADEGEPKVAEDPTVAPSGEPTDGGTDQAPAAPEGDVEAVQAQMEDIVNQLQADGYSQQEIAEAMMEEMGITPDEAVDMVIQDLTDKGFSPDEAQELLANLGELEQQGVTPEQFAQALEGGAM